MRRTLTWLGRGLAVLLLFALAGLTSLLLLLRGSLPQHSGEAQLPGLGAAVSVERDADGVVTLHAADRLDLARGLGFVHAQERYFQMDLLRRVGAGELSALLGPATVDIDREQRRFRLRARILARYDDTPEHERALLEAYSEGVNAGLAALRVRPPEYLLLRQQPQPWTPQDSLLAGAVLYFDLIDEHGLRVRRNAQLAEVLPEALHRFLAPAGSRWDAPLLGEAGELPPLPGPQVYDLRRLDRALFEGEVLSSRGMPELGSNSYAVDDRVSGGLGAIVVSDMHLGLRMPHTWFRVRLRSESPALDATGVTLPGTPLLIAGSNGHVAWAFTNAYGQWTDVIALETHPDRPGEYRSPHGWEREQTVLERIEVAGGEPVPLTVRETRWGPRYDDANGRPLALRWLPLSEGAINLGLADMEQARDLDSAVSIAQRAGIPPQAILIADRSGRIGWTLAGRLPQRAPLPEGLRSDHPLPSAQAADWLDWIPGHAYPRLIDPADGRLWTANARLVGGAELALLGDSGYALGARQKRIADLLQASPTLDYAQLLAIQLDTGNDYLAAWREVFLAALDAPAAADHPRRDEVRTLLAGSAVRADADNAAYRLLRRWHTRSVDAIFHALGAEVRALYPDFRFVPFAASKASALALAEARPAHLLDPRYPDWPSFLLAQLDAVLAGEAGDDRPLAERRWGEANRLAMRHPLSAALPEWLGRHLDMAPVALPGDTDVVRVQGPAFGASQRMAVSPGREAEGYFHMPGGQSGHPLSRHYRAGHDAWVRGEARPFLPGETVDRLQLRP